VRVYALDICADPDMGELFLTRKKTPEGGNCGRDARRIYRLNEGQEGEISMRMDAGA
jgi:hypothetical protein